MEAAASSIWLLFFLLEYETQFTLTALDWLNFNSDNYPARGGMAYEMTSQLILYLKQHVFYRGQPLPYHQVRALPDV
ncbi:hypothetical protein BOO28_18605 [Vibrio navarrensis]|nr:hypothetical protein [Vibrio navarrensis]MBE4613332.1 hypothetical protein [Vibrio navarrensis]